MAIVDAVPIIGKVGVFVNAPLTEVRDIAKRCHLDFVQLSGDESQEYCAQLGYPVIKAVRINKAGVLPGISDYKVAWLLFDTFVPGSYGGTGQTFDWSQVPSIHENLLVPIMVAGGLTPQNIGEAIMKARPQGVDVSGGVETDGQKDLDKIACFIKAARAAEKRIEHA